MAGDEGGRGGGERGGRRPRRQRPSLARSAVARCRRRRNHQRPTATSRTDARSRSRLLAARAHAESRAQHAAAGACEGLHMAHERADVASSVPERGEARSRHTTTDDHTTTTRTTRARARAAKYSRVPRPLAPHERATSHCTTHATQGERASEQTYTVQGRSRRENEGSRARGAGRGDERRRGRSNKQQRPRSARGKRVAERAMRWAFAPNTCCSSRCCCLVRSSLARRRVPVVSAPVLECRVCAVHLLAAGECSSVGVVVCGSIDWVC